MYRIYPCIYWYIQPQSLEQDPLYSDRTPRKCVTVDKVIKSVPPVALYACHWNRTQKSHIKHKMTEHIGNACITVSQLKQIDPATANML